MESQIFSSQIYRHYLTLELTRAFLKQLIFCLLEFILSRVLCACIFPNAPFTILGKNEEPMSRLAVYAQLWKFLEWCRKRFKMGTTHKIYLGAFLRKKSDCFVCASLHILNFFFNLYLNFYITKRRKLDRECLEYFGDFL